jgi:hypothetical protein
MAPFYSLPYILTHTLIACHGQDSALAAAIGQDFKGKISVGDYYAMLDCIAYVLVAAIWIVPECRIERTLIS